MRAVDGGDLVKSFVETVIGFSCLAMAVADCERRPKLNLNELPISAGYIDTQDPVGKVYALRTISTEQ
jgi:hypothetical protein